MKVYSFSFPHKTASMFAFAIASELSKVSGFKLYSNNVKPPNMSKFDEATDGAVIGPLRNYAVTDLLRKNPRVTNVLDIAQVRDPLDICVSQFFSHGWIHGESTWTPDQVEQRRRIQSGEISLAQYAEMELEGEALFGGASILDKWSKLPVDHPAVTRTIVRYEDMMLDWEKWLAAVAEGLGMTGEPFVASVDAMRPEYGEPDEDPRTYFGADIKHYLEERFKATHIRSAWPGEHKIFLAPDEVARLRMLIKQRQPNVAKYYQ